MKEINKSEQWLLNGDCSICRRNKYCSTTCTKAKRKAQAQMKRLVESSIDNATGGAYKQIINKLSDFK